MVSYQGGLFVKVSRLGWQLTVLFVFLHVFVSLCILPTGTKCSPLAVLHSPKVLEHMQRCLQAETPPEGWGTFRKSLLTGLEMQNELGAAREPALGSSCLHHPLQHPRVGEGNKNKM